MKESEFRRAMENFREDRIRTGISRNEMAEYPGISVELYGLYENGVTFPNKSEVARMQALNLPNIEDNAYKGVPASEFIISPEFSDTDEDMKRPETKKTKMEVPDKPEPIVNVKTPEKTAEGDGSDVKTYTKRLSARDKEEAFELTRAGRTVREIADILGAGYSQVWYLLNMASI